MTEPRNTPNCINHTDTRGMNSDFARQRKGHDLGYVLDMYGTQLHVRLFAPFFSSRKTSQSVICINVLVISGPRRQKERRGEFFENEIFTF